MIKVVSVCDMYPRAFTYLVIVIIFYNPLNKEIYIRAGICLLINNDAIPTHLVLGRQHKRQGLCHDSISARFDPAIFFVLST
jgi:hypothetical protein